LHLLVFVLVGQKNDANKRRFRQYVRLLVASNEYKGAVVVVQEGSDEKARWLRDLSRFLPLRSQFVLSGNTRDLHILEAAPGQITAAPLSKVLPDALKEAGYSRIASFDLLNGFRAVEPSDESHLTQLGLTARNGAAAGGIDLLSATIERHVALDGAPAALIIDFASRLIVRSEALSPAEHQLFSRASILSLNARDLPASGVNPSTIRSYGSWTRRGHRTICSKLHAKGRCPRNLDCR
jgi:hypothetical protein